MFAVTIVSREARGTEYGQFGPYDYYNPPKGAISLVERAHMGPVIAEARRLRRWCDYFENIDYSLRAFPNHPEALTLMAEYLDSHAPCSKAPAPKSTRGSSPMDLAAAVESGTWRERNADYYFEKGIEFLPKGSDTVVKRPETRLLYAKYLYNHKRPNEALAQFQEAERLRPSSADAHYYMSAIYLDNKDAEKAKLYADKARQLGAPPAELKQKLISAGHWRDK